jgi:four helix bundle protein
MEANSYESLDVWKRACALSVALFKGARSCKDRSFCDQLVRSGLSVPSNIAEGYERDSSRERMQFLKVAKGSCGELRTQLMIGIRAELLPDAPARAYLKEAAELSKMLHGLIEHYRKQS